MSRLRILVTLGVAGVALIALTTAVGAAHQPVSDISAQNSHTRLDQGGGFTRIQTVTLVSSPEATATALTTIWENRWDNIAYDFFVVPLPADYTSLTVGGEYEVSTEITPFMSLGEWFTNQIKITPTAGLTAFLGYATDSRAAREGNQFRIFIRATSPETSTYLTSVAFNDTLYDFISYQDNPSDTLSLGPPVTATGRVWWGPITVYPDDRFDKYVALIDERLPIDLAFQSFGVTMSGDKHTVQVTATIINSGTVETGNLFYIEFYDRPTGAPAPSGPDDHLWGACADTACATFRRENYEYYPRPGDPPLMPGQTKLITFNYTFGTGGDRDLYLQIDSFGFGSPYGLVYEAAREDNNIESLGTVQAVGTTYLPLIMKNK